MVLAGAWARGGVGVPVVARFAPGGCDTVCSMTVVATCVRHSLLILGAALLFGLLSGAVAGADPQRPVIALPEGVYVHAGLYEDHLRIDDDDFQLIASEGETAAETARDCAPQVRTIDAATYLGWEMAACLGLSLPSELPYMPRPLEPLLNVTAAPATDSVRIILDAGHGGEDPGAVGVDGIKEKDITLALARAMFEKLSTVPGFDVYMTRTGDRFISLRDRAEMANRLQADLFISLHGNAGFRETARGVEIFIAGHQADDAHARELAMLENSVEEEPLFHNGSTAELLADLALADQLQHSAHTAAGMLTAMTRDLEVANRGVKRAPFWVLLGSNMPAVLVETGFLTNRDEGRLLADPEYQARIAQSLVTALEELQPNLLNRRVRSNHGPFVRQEGTHRLATP